MDLWSLLLGETVHKSGDPLPPGDEWCPSRKGHYTMFGTLRCNTCDNMVGTDSASNSERRPLF